MFDKFSIFLLLIALGYPYLKIGKLKGNKTTALEFYTRTLPCLEEYYSLFYNGDKRVPENIYHLLTPPALAH